jgi:hypothetical protein
VPCSEDLGNASNQANLTITAQMLIYNEFEQRFSTNSRVQCYSATRLSDIDTQPGPAGDQFSIFSVGIGRSPVDAYPRRSWARWPVRLRPPGCWVRDAAATPGGDAVATTAFNLQHVASARRRRGHERFPVGPTPTPGP